MKCQAAIDELYSAIENEEDFGLSAEYASKLMQIAAVCSGQHVYKISQQFELKFDMQQKMIDGLIQSLQQSIESYITKVLSNQCH